MSISKELKKVPLPIEAGCDSVPGEVVNLNEVITTSIKPYLLSGRNRNIIVRCANLPSVPGNRRVLQSVFDTLVRMIMVCPGSIKRFLHIQCEEQRSRPSMTVVTSYCITFHTNLTTDQEWKHLNEESLLHCQQKLVSANGLLSVHEISTTGCLFSISLQGKIN
jgi:hypothetical protein